MGLHSLTPEKPRFNLTEEQKSTIANILLVLPDREFRINSNTLEIRVKSNNYWALVDAGIIEAWKNMYIGIFEPEMISEVI